jgi:hypothetical protein
LVHAWFEYTSWKSVKHFSFVNVDKKSCSYRLPKALSHSRPEQLVISCSISVACLEEFIKGI